MRFAAAAGAIALATVAAPRAPVPQTLHSGPGRVAAVTQDGQTLAWLDAAGSGCNAVHVLGVNGSTTSAPKPAAASMTCRWDVSDGKPELALAEGASALLWTLHQGGGAALDYVMTAGIGAPEVRVDKLAHGSDGTGLWLGGVAGDRTTLAYSDADVEYADKLACLSGGSCKRVIAGGGIHLVSQGQQKLLPGSKPALSLSASDGRIAYIQATAPDPAAPPGPPVPSAGLPIRVVSATSGAGIASVRPLGVPLAIALAPDVLAVLSRKLNLELVSWYDAASGTELGSVPVSPRAANELAASDRAIVYRVGRTMREISLSTGRIRTLARAAVTPLGFTLAGPRLAWAENRSATSRIRAVSLR